MLSNLSKQSFQNWELVIVDDASNDTLGEYISQQKFIPAKKIKYLFLRENHGPYYARKVAFASSTGLYVICIDADDTLIGEKALSILYKCITKHPVDILFFNATRNLISLDRYIDYCGSGLHNGYLHPSKVQDLFLSTSLFNNLWAKVIKRSVLHPVSFDKADGLKMCEDRLEMAGAILKSASFFYLILVFIITKIKSAPPQIAFITMIIANSKFLLNRLYINYIQKKKEIGINSIRNFLKYGQMMSNA